MWFCRRLLKPPQALEFCMKYSFHSLLITSSRFLVHLLTDGWPVNLPVWLSAAGILLCRFTTSGSARLYPTRSSYLNWVLGSCGVQCGQRTLSVFARQRHYVSHKKQSLFVKIVIGWSWKTEISVNHFWLWTRAVDTLADLSSASERRAVSALLALKRKFELYQSFWGRPTIRGLKQWAEPRLDTAVVKEDAVSSRTLTKSAVECHLTQAASASPAAVKVIM